MLFRSILAWTVPDIDFEVYNQPALLATALPTRVALSFRGDRWHGFGERLEILHVVLAGLPLGGLVVLAAHELRGSPHEGDLPTHSFWLRLLVKWPLLQRVLLSPHATSGFIEMLLRDDGGRERPLLPSLTELVMVDFSLYSLSLLPLYDALAKRMEREVPLKRLDLRMCHSHSDGRNEGWLQSLSEVVVDILAPEKSSEARQKMKSMWKTVACGPFVDEDGLSDSAGPASDDDDE